MRALVREDGKRVKKRVPSTDETTIFVYDAAGKLIGEYSTVVADVEDAKVAYLTADHLGSPRINTDRDGKVTARYDYHPYGEEIITAQRASHAEYTPDSVRKQFTGYERDGESGLDFAEARMYSNSLGRFTSSDPLMASAKTGVPKTWNRYVYGLNSPLKYVDPDGMDVKMLDKKAVDRVLSTLPESALANGNFRVTLSDGTGEASTAPDWALAGAAAEELYVHASAGLQGKPWQHEKYTDAEGNKNQLDPKGPINRRTAEVRTRTENMHKAKGTAPTKKP